MTSILNVAVAQITGAAFANEANRQLTVDVCKRAFSQGAKLVVLPELIVQGYALDGEKLRQGAEPLDGPTLASWCSLASGHDGYIAGGFCERDGDRIFNTAVLVGPDGLILHYRKLHLFDREKEIFTLGDLGLPIADTAIGKVGLCVCYDLRFMEVARSMALRGADMLIVPTAWVPGFDLERWDAQGYCPQARGAAYQANHSQIYIICASQAGSNGAMDFLGSSLIADPYGKSVIGPLSGNKSEVAHAALDLSKTNQALSRSGTVSPRADRRTDVYSILIDGERL